MAGLGKKDLKASNGEIGAYKTADKSLHKLKRDWPLIWERSKNLLKYLLIVLSVSIAGIVTLHIYYGVSWKLASPLLVPAVSLIASVGNRGLQKGEMWSTRNQILRLSRMLRGMSLMAPFGDIAAKKYASTSDTEDPELRKDTAADMSKWSGHLTQQSETLSERKLMAEAIADRIVGKKPEKPGKPK